MASFWEELSRRKVVKVAVAYGIVALGWLVTDNSPPSASTIRLLIGSPNPVPPNRRVTLLSA